MQEVKHHTEKTTEAYFVLSSHVSHIVNADFKSTLCKSEIYMHQEILYSVWGRLTATVAMPTTMIAGRNFISNPGSAFTAPAVSPTSPVKVFNSALT